MKNLPLIIGAIVILALGVGGYMYMQNGSASGSTDEKKMMGTGNGPSSGMMSIKDLLTQGGNQMCTFSSSGENGMSEGTTYVSGQNIRTDFSGTSADGQTYEGHSIMDGTYMYTWTSPQEPGFKIAMDQDYETMMEEAEEYQAEETTTNNQVDINEKLDYKCSAWNGDSAMFVPPADVEFTDFSEQIKMMQETLQNSSEVDPSSGMDSKAEQCSVCDSLTGEAQTACRQAIGC